MSLSHLNRIDRLEQMLSNKNKLYWNGEFIIHKLYHTANKSDLEGYRKLLNKVNKTRSKLDFNKLIECLKKILVKNKTKILAYRIPDDLYNAMRDKRFSEREDHFLKLKAMEEKYYKFMFSE